MSYDIKLYIFNDYLNVCKTVKCLFFFNIFTCGQINNLLRSAKSSCVYWLMGLNVVRGQSCWMREHNWPGCVWRWWASRWATRWRRECWGGPHAARRSAASKPARCRDCSSPACWGWPRCEPRPRSSGTTNDSNNERRCGSSQHGCTAINTMYWDQIFHSKEGKLWITLSTHLSYLLC